MKSAIAPSSNAAGSALLTTIVVLGIFGMAVLAFLTLMMNQNQLVARSQVWNSALPVAEAGIEEALTHCAKDSLNLAVNGWALSSGKYVKSQAVDDGGLSGKIIGFFGLSHRNGYFDTSISTATQPWTIISKGYYPMPGSDTFVCRTVQITISNRTAFLGGIVVKDSFDMNGNDVLVDSYDSEDPNKSTVGAYDPLKASDKGDVACLSGITNSLKVGNANIWGHAFTGPTGGVYTGPNGAVGSASWQKGANSGIESGWLKNDLNMVLPDMEEPFVSATPPASGVIGGVSYNFVLANGNYMMSKLTKNTVVTGNAVLYVTDGIAFGGSDTITIMPGASLTLFNAGSDASFNPIVNSNGMASSFMYCGLNSNNGTVSLNGSKGALVGCIYAPYAKVQLSGGATIFGLICARSAKATGNSAIHYDEALARRSFSRGFVILTWKEI